MLKYRRDVGRTSEQILPPRGVMGLPRCADIVTVPVSPLTGLSSGRFSCGWKKVGSSVSTFALSGLSPVMPSIGMAPDYLVVGPDRFRSTGIIEGFDSSLHWTSFYSTWNLGHRGAKSRNRHLREGKPLLHNCGIPSCITGSSYRASDATPVTRHNLGPSLSSSK